MGNENQARATQKREMGKWIFFGKGLNDIRERWAC